MGKEVERVANGDRGSVMAKWIRKFDECMMVVYYMCEYWVYEHNA
jgi:hypothetical protein